MDLGTVELCVVTMNYKHWAHAKEVFKALKYKKKVKSLFEKVIPKMINIIQ